MRIAITINTAWNVYNFRLGLIHALIQNGHQVIAVTPHDEFAEKLIEEGCEFVPLAMENKGANPIRDFGIYRSLIRIYREQRIDVALQYTIKPNIYGTLAAKKLGVPVINNISGLGTTFIRKNFVGRVAELLYWVSLRHAALVFFQNRDDQSLFLDQKLVKQKNTALVPGSGVNLSRFAFETTQRKLGSPIRFLLIARLLYDKGIIEFVEAARRLKSEGLDLECSICGFLDLEASLGVPLDDVKKWEEEGLIKYLGSVEKIESVIRDADCVVLPSYREGTPKSLLEAAAMGKPLVATDVPGCREVVQDQVNGFLCDAKSSSSLAEAMRNVLNATNDELARMGRQSRLLVEQSFDEKLVIMKYLQAIQEIMDDSKFVSFKE